MRTIECPVCEGRGLVDTVTMSGGVVRDGDGVPFPTMCRRCFGHGKIEVADDYEEVIDDREGNDDYRKEDKLEHDTE